MPSSFPAAELARIARFGVVGLLSSGIYLAIFYVLQRLMPPVPASVLAYVLSAMLNYLMQSTFTFGRVPVRGATIARFMAAHLVCMATNSLLLWVLTERVGLPPVQTQSVLIFAIAALSYLLSRLWVFGPDLAARAEAEAQAKDPASA